MRIGQFKAIGKQLVKRPAVPLFCRIERIEPVPPLYELDERWVGEGSKDDVLLGGPVRARLELRIVSASVNVAVARLVQLLRPFAMDRPLKLFGLPNGIWIRIDFPADVAEPVSRQHLSDRLI